MIKKTPLFNPVFYLDKIHLCRNGKQMANTALGIYWNDM